MSKIFILNGAHTHPYAKGELNATFTKKAQQVLKELGHEVRVTNIADGYDVEAEISNHQWADSVIFQFPINWMGVPWSMKKYLDEVYTAGMDGRLCAGDGRTEEAPKANYGTGGSLKNTTYMLSITLNAPAEAFNNPNEPLLAGGSIDDLLRPMHLNAQFMAMKPLATFAAYDVMKNAEVEADLVRFDAQLRENFAAKAAAA